MNNFSNRAGRLALCAMLAATATLVATKSFAAPHYDGTWSVLVVTEKGTATRPIVIRSASPTAR